MNPFLFDDRPFRFTREDIDRWHQHRRRQHHLGADGDLLPAEGGMNLVIPKAWKEVSEGEFIYSLSGVSWVRDGWGDGEYYYYASLRNLLLPFFRSEPFAIRIVYPRPRRYLLNPKYLTKP